MFQSRATKIQTPAEILPGFCFSNSISCQTKHYKDKAISSVPSL